jgi:glycosyltransferase involved in cell wall biosynthesis
VRLVHVGAIGRELAFPTDDARFIHVDTVPQAQLPRFYAEADAFILASRQDGFGVVLVQALASGLPVICTDRTGGADLAHTPAIAKWITIIPHDDLPALSAAVARLRDCRKSGECLPRLADSDRETLSWSAYGRRYAEQIAADFRSE